MPLEGVASTKLGAPDLAESGWDWVRAWARAGKTRRSAAESTRAQGVLRSGDIFSVKLLSRSAAELGRGDARAEWRESRNENGFNWD